MCTCTYCSHELTVASNERGVTGAIDVPGCGESRREVAAYNLVEPCAFYIGIHYEQGCLRRINPPDSADDVALLHFDFFGRPNSFFAQFFARWPMLLASVLAASVTALSWPARAAAAVVRECA